MIHVSDHVKKIILISAVALYALTVSGCGAAGVDLSDEDAKKVANYSSDVVSQHNDKSDTRLVSLATVKKKYQDQETELQGIRAGSRRSSCKL